MFFYLKMVFEFFQAFQSADKKFFLVHEFNYFKLSKQILKIGLDKCRIMLYDEVEVRIKMTEERKRIVDDAKKGLEFVFFVYTQHTIDEMYEDYIRQRKEKGLPASEKSRLVFLESGISSRDEDRDYNVSDCIKEAEDVYGRISKSKKSNFVGVVLKLGYSKTVCVVQPELRKPEQLRMEIIDQLDKS